MGSGNVSCIAECIAFSRASFRSISSQGSDKEVKLIKTQQYYRHTIGKLEQTSVEDDVAETYCRLPTEQCSRMQEQEMKVAPEEHAEAEQI